MRLIDANELKEWVKNWFIKNKYYHPYSKSNDIPINELYDILEQVPTIDAVQVVRCKDCKFNYANQIPSDDACQLCVELPISKDFFCAYGEKTEANDENI